MTGRKLLAILLLQILSICLSPFYAQTSDTNQQPSRNILILNSYHVGDEWEENIRRGIESVLSGNSYAIFHEYLDARRSLDARSQELFAAHFRYKYRNIKPDIIIGTDDAALEFLMRYRDEMFPGVSVVCCGINDYSPERLAGIKGFKIVKEEVDFPAIIDMALKIFKDTEFIYVNVNTHTINGKMHYERFKKLCSGFQNGPRGIKIKYLMDLGAEEAETVMKSLPPKSIIIHLANFHDKNRNEIDIDRTMEILNKSGLPVFCFVEPVIRKGALGGKVVSGFAQGKAAAELALTELEGKGGPAQDISPSDSPNVYLFNWEQMKKFGLMREDLPPGSQIIGEEVSFYKAYRLWIAGIILLATLQIILISAIMANRINRKRAEDELKKAEAILMTAVNQSTSGLIVIDDSSKTRVVNDAAANICMSDKEKMSKISAQDYSNMDFIPYHENGRLYQIEELPVVRSLKNGEEINNELIKIVRRDGSERWLLNNSAPVRNAEGQITGAITFFNDISDTIRVQKNLEELKILMESVMQQSPVPFVIADSTTRKVILINEAMRKILGISDVSVFLSLDIDYLVNKRTWKQFTFEGESADRETPLRSVMNGNVINDLELKIVRLDGSERMVLVSGTPIYNRKKEQIAGVIAILDVTEQREAEKAIRESRSNLQILFDSIDDPLIIYKLSGEIVFFNPAAVRKLGYSGEELLSMKAIQLYGDTEKEDADNVLKEIFAGKRNSHTIPICTKNGSRIPVYTKTAFGRWSGQEVIFSFSRDISEIRKAEQSIKDNEENLRLILQSIGDGVIAVSPTGSVIRMNKAAEKICGWRMEETIGIEIGQILKLSRENSSLVENPVKEVFSMNVVNKEGASSDYMLEDRTGVKHKIDLSGSPILNSKGELVGAVLVFRDVTRQTMLEEHMRQSQKMDSIGQLAGGIAHDFNNMLLAILGSAEILALKLADKEDLKIYADLIMEAGDNATKLTRKLLDFSRKGKSVTETVDVNNSINSVMSILSRSIDKRINLEACLNAEQTVIKGDPSQIQNIWMNLAINARDAMPDGGTIKFITRNVDVDKSFIEASHFGLEEGLYISVEVADTGKGMSKEVADRIFEPFFTTKKSGEGTGMGLSIVYGTVKEHKGIIKVYSEPGRGSTFKIFLPINTENIQQTSKVHQHQSDSHIKRLKGSILIADDEKLVRNISEFMLRKSGADVITACDGEEAVNIYKKNKDKIDLVILDMVMPNKNGKDTFYELKKINPELKVIICSGFSMNVEVSELLADGAACFVQKPFTKDDLIAAIKTAIDKKGS